ncbi:MAG: hypothetical protein K5905_12260 [Roseibium sp.]|uniref:hypothetical protein n=1 Tax=Roseibium sp. TaxID=1936156 RepID=UPI00261917F5|nr:hypothetical protein [Roseibium sp.]MCV0426240.1 hypothetical protein [Roseibium sp.]
MFDTSKACLLMAVSLTLGISTPLLAEESNPEILGCLDAVGTYLTKRTVTIDEKTRVDRGLIALTNGGHAFVTDSAEGGVAGYQPFSDGRGSWRCLGHEDGKSKLKIVMFDFTTSPDANADRYMARVTTLADADPETGEVTGLTTVEFLAIDASPDTTDTVRPSVGYDFTGVRLEVAE